MEAKILHSWLKHAHLKQLRIDYILSDLYLHLYKA